MKSFKNFLREFRGNIDDYFKNNRRDPEWDPDDHLRDWLRSVPYETKLENGGLLKFNNALEGLEHLTRSEARTSQARHFGKNTSFGQYFKDASLTHDRHIVNMSEALEKHGSLPDFLRPHFVQSFSNIASDFTIDENRKLADPDEGNKTMAAFMNSHRGRESTEENHLSHLINRVKQRPDEGYYITPSEMQ